MQSIPEALVAEHDRSALLNAKCSPHVTRNDHTAVSGNLQFDAHDQKSVIKVFLCQSRIDRRLLDPRRILLNEIEAVFGVLAHQSLDEIADARARLVFLWQGDAQ